MFKATITPNKQWIEACNFMKEMPQRYEWFQFEFGKRIANIFLSLLEEEIGNIHRGPIGYKKRMVVAEIRDTNSKFWFAVAAKAVPMSSSIHTPDNCILKVVSRFPPKQDDPIAEILQAYGPWTVDTIPYIPSKRFAIVTIEPASKAKVEHVKQINKNKEKEIRALMYELNLVYDFRMDVARKLKIVEDLEKVVNEMEFGLGPRYSPHWSRALRRLKTTGIKQLLMQRDLIASMSNPKFKKYRVKSHLKVKMSSQEVRDLESFQKRLLKTL